MAVTKEQLATDNSCSATGSATGNSTGDSTGGTASGTTSGTTSSTTSGATSSAASGATKKSTKKQTRRRTARKSGAERLRSAADRRVGQNSKELADLLLGKALAGELAYAKVLVGLADGKKPEPGPEKRHWLSFIEQLATEPEWAEPGNQKQ